MTISSDSELEKDEDHQEEIIEIEGCYENEIVNKNEVEQKNHIVCDLEDF